MRDIKAFSMRVPKDIWLFLKKVSAEQDKSMMEVVLEQVNKYKKSYEKRLTSHDTYG